MLTIKAPLFIIKYRKKFKKFPFPLNSKNKNKRAADGTGFLFS